MISFLFQEGELRLKGKKRKKGGERESVTQEVRFDPVHSSLIGKKPSSLLGSHFLF